MVIRKRLDISGPAIAFVTTTVFEWKPVWARDEVESVLVEELRNLRSQFQVAIISYVIMPSHIHLLLGFSDIELISKCIQTFKSITSRRV